jgi:general secretion pathway protein F
MARFEYLALDPAGRSASGFIRAADASAARAALEKRKLAPVKVLPAANDATATPKVPKIGLLQRGIGSGALALITRQLATLIKVAPVEEALRTIAAQIERPSVRKVVLDTHAGVLEGRRLSEAMAGQGKVFPPLYRAMVAAGEASGALPQILERLADLLEREQTARARLLTALIYPAALAAVAVVVVIALMTFVVPKVVDQFESMGQTLPLLTRIIIFVSEAMRDWGWLALIVAAIAGLGFAQGLRKPKFRLKFDGWLLKLPLIGKLIRNQNAARLARTLATMIAAGAPVMEGLSLTARTVHNRVLRAATEEMAASIREGGSLSAAMRRADVFPPILVHMTASGEAGGQLEPMLESAAEYLERETNTFTQVTLSLLEPAIIIIMGALVALIVLSILLPILQINTLTLR